MAGGGFADVLGGRVVGGGVGAAVLGGRLAGVGGAVGGKRGAPVVEARVEGLKVLLTVVGGAVALLVVAAGVLEDGFADRLGAFLVTAGGFKDGGRCRWNPKAPGKRGKPGITPLGRSPAGNLPGRPGGFRPGNPGKPSPILGNLAAARNSDDLFLPGPCRNP